MPYTFSHRTAIGVLSVCVLFLGATDLALWRRVVVDKALAETVVRESARAPAHAELPNAVPEFVAAKAILAADVPMEFPAQTTPQEIIPPAAVPVPPVPQVKTGAPVRIMVKSINLDAAIERVGLTAEGAMDVPKRPFNAGWYSLGRRPGEQGAAVIAGHVDWTNGATGVFKDLALVQPGEQITVRDDRGVTTTFVVRETRTYDAEADAAEVFGSGDGKSHLNLITCIGDWDREANQYAQRLVVFTDKREE